MDRGITLLDMAPAYGNGEAESVVGAAFEGKLPAGMTLHETPGVAVGPDDHVYLLTRNTANPVIVLTREGEFVRTFRDPKFVAFLTDNLTEPNVGTPDEFAAQIKVGYERAGRFAKQFNLQPE